MANLPEARPPRNERGPTLTGRQHRQIGSCAPPECACLLEDRNRVGNVGQLGRRECPSGRLRRFCDMMGTLTPTLEGQSLEWLLVLTSSVLVVVRSAHLRERGSAWHHLDSPPR